MEDLKFDERFKGLIDESIPRKTLGSWTDKPTVVDSDKCENIFVKNYCMERED